MTVLANILADRRSLAGAFADESQLIVVSFCAAWCDTCGQFRTAYERIAAARPDMRFVWLDIEDDSAVAGDVDVENFPTLAVYRGATPLHFGMSLPQEGTVARLIDALSERTESAEVPVPFVPSARLRDSLSARPRECDAQRDQHHAD